MKNLHLTPLSGDVLEEDIEWTLSELCQACSLASEQIYILVDHGVIEPQGQEPSCWRFDGISLQRVRIVQRLEQDLGVNVAGAALALELLEELQALRARLQRFEK